MAPKQEKSRQERYEDRERFRRMKKARGKISKDALDRAFSNTPQSTRFNRNRDSDFQPPPVTTAAVAQVAAKRPPRPTAIDATPQVPSRGGHTAGHSREHEGEVVGDNCRVPASVISNRQHPPGAKSTTRDSPDDLRRGIARKKVLLTYSKHSQYQITPRHDIFSLKNKDVAVQAEPSRQVRARLSDESGGDEEFASESRIYNEQSREDSGLHPSSPRSSESLTLKTLPSRLGAEAANTDFNVKLSSFSYDDTRSHFTVKQGEESQSSSREDLEELEVEILDLSLQSSPPCLPFVCSPKHPISSSIDAPPDPDLYEIQYQIDSGKNGTDHGVEEPSPKKRHRTNRKNVKLITSNAALHELNERRKSEASRRPTVGHAGNSERNRETKANMPPKKNPRRLPVGELVIMSDKLRGSDLEIPRSQHAELSQDPISQSSLPEENFEIGVSNRQRVTRVHITIRQKKGLGNIDLKQFRIPRVQQATPRSRQGQKRVASWSDGFEGKEGCPTGRTMHVKQLNLRERTVHRVTYRMNELTIVTDEEFGDTVPVRQVQQRSEQQCRKKKHVQIHTPAEKEAASDHRDDAILINGQEQHDENEGVERLRGENISVTVGPKTPKFSTAENSTLDYAAATSSPLKRKVRHVSQISQDPRLPASQRTLFRRNESDEVAPSQQMKMVPDMKKTPRRHKNIEELEISQQLSMVSIKKRPGATREETDGYTSEDDEQSSEQSNSGEESEDSNDSRQEDFEEDLTQEGSSTSDAEGENEHGVWGQEAKKHDQQTNQNQFATVQAEVEQHPQQLGMNDSRAEKPTVVSAQQTSDLARQALLLMDADTNHSQKQQRRVREQTTKLQHETRTRDTAQEDDQLSWRIRKPHPSPVTMEVDEDVFDSPTRQPNDPDQAAKRRSSRAGSRSLMMVQSRRSSPISVISPLNTMNSQGSVILGDSQRLVRLLDSTIPETQFEEEEQTGIPESQLSFVPEESYFQRASQSLQRPTRRLNPHRIKSIPAKLYLNPSIPNMMAGGTTLSNAFQHTISPNKTGSRLPSLLEEGSKQRKGLTELTRQASIGSGIMAGSARKRMVSLPFTPPFMPQK